MRNIELLLILAVVIIVASFVQGNILNKNKTKVIKNNLPTPTLTPSPTPTIIISPTATVYKKISIPTPTQGSTNSGQNINDYRYQNSSIKESKNDKLIIESSDDPTIITNWYKDKLKSQNMNINSFVTTNTNSNILNKLVSANGATKVSISISKGSLDTQTKITIDISH